jgi:hypothetical protein
MGQIRENKQEVIDVVYNFYADLYTLSNSKYKVCSFLRSSSAKFLEKVILKLFIFFLADLYKGQNIGLDEIKEYLTHLDLKKLDEEDWTYFDIFFYLQMKV